MKQTITMLLVLLCFGFLGHAQSKINLGIHTGYDQNINHLLNFHGENTNAAPDFNIGFDASLYLGGRIRLRGELKYANISYTHDYGFAAEDGNIWKSKISVNNLNLNPRFDYRLFSIRDLDLYATTGLRLEFSLGSWGRSEMYGGETNQSIYFSDEYTKAMGGAIGGFILKYNITQDWGITLNPEYTYFFREFYSQNDTEMQRMSLNLGVEWRF